MKIINKMVHRFVIIEVEKIIYIYIPGYIKNFKKIECKKVCCTIVKNTTRMVRVVVVV